MRQGSAAKLWMRSTVEHIARGCKSLPGRELSCSAQARSKNGLLGLHLGFTKIKRYFEDIVCIDFMYSRHDSSISTPLNPDIEPLGRLEKILLTS